MKLGKRAKILLLLASVLPVLFGFYMMIWYFMHLGEFFALMPAPGSSEPDPAEFFGKFMQLMLPVFIASMLMFFVQITLLVIYIMHAVKDPRNQGSEKVLWILGFLFFPFPVELIYWFVRVWPDPEPESVPEGVPIYVDED